MYDFKRLITNLLQKINITERKARKNNDVQPKYLYIVTPLFIKLYS